MAVPSKVLHLRNLPEGCLETDIRAYCELFGTINRFLLMSKKQQALVEFSSIDEAAQMLESLSLQPVRLANRYVRHILSKKY